VQALNAFSTSVDVRQGLSRMGFLDENKSVGFGQP
jgi:hypothetical protein